jgi:hypothetical protein
MDSLFEIPESVPKWRELADRHGIFAHFSPDMEESERWSAWSFHCLESMEPDWRKREPIDLIAEYCAFIDEEAGSAEYAGTEREAVVSLIHRLQLEGWQTISVREP